MKILVSICLIALSNGIALGGVVREEDIIGMVQDFFSNPDDYALSIANVMRRFKRSNWDKELNLQKLGFSYRIKYNEPSNKLQGLSAEIEFKDIRKFMNGVPIKSAKLVVTADDLSSFGDGLFNININYGVGFLSGGQDTGTIHCEGKMEGEFYVTQFHFMSDSENNIDRPPTINIEFKSDSKTKETVRLLIDDHKTQGLEVTLEVAINTTDTIKGVFKWEKTYSFEGKFNMRENKVDLIVNLDGKKHNGFANFDIDIYGSQGMLMGKLDLGTAGKFVFSIYAKTDMSEAVVNLRLNNKDIFTANLKGDLDQSPSQFQYEASYSGMNVGEGKVIASYERFKKMKFQYLPTVGMNFDLKIDLDDNKTWTIKATATEDQKKTFEVKTKCSLVEDDSSLGFNTEIGWFIEEGSQFLRLINKINYLHCPSSFAYESNHVMEKNKLYKFDFHENKIRFSVMKITDIMTGVNIAWDIMGIKGLSFVILGRNDYLGIFEVDRYYVFEEPDFEEQDMKMIPNAILPYNLYYKNEAKPCNCSNVPIGKEKFGWQYSNSVWQYSNSDFQWLI